MKALVANRYGGLEVLRLGELDAPRPRQDQAVVDVRAASINPADFKLLSGKFKFFRRLKFPSIPGLDFAGVVREVGGKVTRFSPGQRVYGYLDWTKVRQGTHAEQVAVPEAELRALPDALSFEQAAGLACVGLTSIDGLRHCGTLAGKTVLVNGAAGGVGHVALQLAKLRGAAHIIGVCSPHNAELVLSLGAQEALDYHSVDVTDGKLKVDVLFDAYGYLDIAQALRALNPGGVLCTTQPLPAMWHAAWRKLVGGPRVVIANAKAEPRNFEEIEGAVANGGLRVAIERILSLTEAIDGFRWLVSGSARGKVVLTMEAV